MTFDKLHGAGNDFICLIAPPGEGAAALARRLCARHTGVGADGLLLLDTSDTADFRMIIFNADGSRAAMCGNGIRCAVRCAVDRGLTPRLSRFSVETDAGLRSVLPRYEDGEIVSATVDMGAPEILWAEQPFEIGGEVHILTAVSMGNPHAVLFSDCDGLLRRLGPALQNHPRFPGGINLELVQVLRPDLLRVLVWERGTGETLACGTGACAALAAALILGRAAPQAEVRLPGGTLVLTYRSDSGHILLTGPVTRVFTGSC